MANRYFNQFFMALTNGLVGLHGSANLAIPVLAAVTGQGITYTAKALGTLGNGITITLVGGGTAGAEVVSLTGAKAIQVQIESGVSTRTQVKTAVDGFAGAAALVSVGVVSGATVATSAVAITTVGGVNGVSSFSALGIASITYTAVGQITIVLSDDYQALDSCGLTLQFATPQDLVPQIKSVNVSASSKTIVVNLLTGATPTAPSGVGKLYFAMRLRNSSVVF